jgi:hypothetical protein
VIDDKPEYFFTPEHRLAEPGPAALALTVGSVALSGAPAELPGRHGWSAVSERDEASAFTRIGPGLGTASKRVNKPEVAHYGGNLVVTDVGMPVANDPGASIVTTASRADGRLFAAVNGTSYAAPAVARIAADVAHQYPDASANLIRALLALSAHQPGSAMTMGEPHRRAAIYGYGIPNPDRATTSTDTRVIMTYDGSIAVDTVRIHLFRCPNYSAAAAEGSGSSPSRQRLIRLSAGNAASTWRRL